MKLLRRAMLVWCLYGIGRLCILVNPLLFWVAGRITPYYDDRSDTEQIISVWIGFVLIAGLAFSVGVLVHFAAQAIFNEKTDDKESSDEE